VEARLSLGWVESPVVSCVVTVVRLGSGRVWVEEGAAWRSVEVHSGGLAGMRSVGLGGLDCLCIRECCYGC
jgi:hypothetical protein